MSTINRTLPKTTASLAAQAAPQPAKSYQLSVATFLDERGGMGQWGMSLESAGGVTVNAEQPVIGAGKPLTVSISENSLPAQSGLSQEQKIQHLFFELGPATQGAKPSSFEIPCSRTPEGDLIPQPITLPIPSDANGTYRFRFYGVNSAGNEVYQRSGPADGTGEREYNLFVARDEGPTLTFAGDASTPPVYQGAPLKVGDTLHIIYDKDRYETVLSNPVNRQFPNAIAVASAAVVERPGELPRMFPTVVRPAGGSEADVESVIAAVPVMSMPAVVPWNEAVPVGSTENDVVVWNQAAIFGFNGKTYEGYDSYGGKNTTLPVSTQS